MGEVYLISDDAGVSAEMTDAILLQWQQGSLDGFSILANGSALSRIGTALSSSARPCRISAHLNLTDGPPCAPPDAVAELLGPDGRLRLGFGALLWKELFLRNAARRSRFLSQVRLEWKAQLDIISRLAGSRRIECLDGHNHIHMLPMLFPIAAKLAVDYGLASIRVSAEPFYLASIRDLGKPQYWVNLLKHILLRILARSARRTAARYGLKCGSVVGVLYSGRMSAEAIRTGIEAADDGPVEVILHSGQANLAEVREWTRRQAALRFFTSHNRSLEAHASREYKMARAGHEGR